MALQTVSATSLKGGGGSLLDQRIWFWHHDQGNGIGFGNVTKETSRIEQDTALCPRLMHSIPRELKQRPCSTRGKMAVRINCGVPFSPHVLIKPGQREYSTKPNRLHMKKN